MDRDKCKLASVSVTGNTDRKLLEKPGRKLFFDGGFPEAEQEKQQLVPVLPVAPAQPGVCGSPQPGQGTGKLGGAVTSVSLCCGGGPCAGVLGPP